MHELERRVRLTSGRLQPDDAALHRATCSTNEPAAHRPSGRRVTDPGGVVVVMRNRRTIILAVLGAAGACVLALTALLTFARAGLVVLAYS